MRHPVADFLRQRQAFIDYALPLIQGEVKRPLKDGLPVYLYR